MRGAVAPLGRGRTVAALVLCLIGGPAAAQGTPGSRVLIMPFAVEVADGAAGGAGAALWLGEAASVLLVERLSALGVGTLSRDQRVLAFDELDLPMSAGLTRATTLRVAELIDATEVIFGRLHLGTTLRVEARIVRLNAGRELEPVVDEAPLVEIFGSFGRLAARIAAQTGRVRPPSDDRLAPLPLDVFEEYVKGLVAPTREVQRQLLESAVRAVPGDARIRMALWRVYSALGEHERALASASTVSSQAPVARNARFAVALSLIELGRFDGAYQTLTQLYAAGRSAAVSNALGVVQLRRPPEPSVGQPAATYFRRAVEEDSENTDYLFNLGFALARTGAPDEAVTWLREVVRLDAANGDAHLVMSTVLAAAGRWPEAEREGELARLLGVSVPAAAGAVDLVALGLERLPATADVAPAPRLAVAIANPAQRDQAATATFHLANGKTLIADRRDRDAIDELRRAIYLAPYDHEPHLLLGQTYHRVGQLDQAIDELKVALWCEETAAGRIALARALLDAGDLDGAVPEVERAAVLAPASAEVAALRERIGR